MIRFRAYQGLAVGLALALLSSWTVVAGAAPNTEAGVDSSAVVTQSLAAIDGPESHFGFSRVLNQTSSTTPGAQTNTTNPPQSNVAAGAPACTNVVGGICPITGAGATGTFTKTGSGTLTINNITLPAGVAGTTAPAVGTLPVLFVPTTVNANPGEQVVCSGIVVTAGVFTTNCNGNLQGDPIANANATLIFTQFNGARGTPVVLLINPGVFIPAAGAVAPVGVPFANAIPQVAIPAVPRPPVQFIPSPPPPLLPPLGGIPPLQAPGAAMAPPSYPEVPVIPEADTVLLLVGGLAALGAVAALRGRGSRRRDD